jgi:Na+-driven multidrug efflux pump
MKEEIKEEFCGACLAVPLAFAGVGASAYGSTSKGKYKSQQKIKKYMLIGGIILTVISIIVAWWFLKKCKSCR